MKSKFLFLSALLMAFFIGFTACDNNENDGPDPNRGNDGDAWLALSIRTGITTRGINDPDQETGTEDESEVKSVRVILFDGYDPTSVVTNDVTLTGTNLLTGSDGFKVSSKAEALLVIVNPPAANKFHGVIVGTSTLADVNAAISDAAVADVIGSTGFMMTNASGLLEPQTYSSSAPPTPLVENGKTGVKAKTKTDKTVAEQAANRLKLDVDRVAAKVRLYNNATSPTAPGSVNSDDQVVLTYSDVKWGLNILNRRYFPMSQRVTTYLEDEEGITTWSAEKYNLGSYRIDPNYDDGTESDGDQTITFAADGTPTYTAFYRNNYLFADADDSGNTFTIDFKDPSTAAIDPDDEESGSTNTKSNTIYCLENTQSQPFNQHAYTTHAVLRAKVYPSHYKQADGNFAPSNATGDFIKISNGYYTFDILMDWIKSELVTFYSNGRTPALTQAFMGYISYLKGKSVSGVELITLPLKDDDETAEDQADTAVALFTAQKAAITGHGADASGAVSYHAEGYSYYKIMIKHDDTDLAVNEHGEFGVVRNSVYDIRLRSIKNIGYPVIPKPTPDPDEEEDAYLAIEIAINPWTWYSQIADL